MVASAAQVLAATGHLAFIIYFAFLVRSDLVVVLKRLAEKRKAFGFTGVIVETTGMADPAPVAQTFFVDDEIKELYKLDGIITVVDAKHIMQHLAEEKPDGVENESVEQVCLAVPPSGGKNFSIPR
jgi:G3E family GTPase